MSCEDQELLAEFVVESNEHLADIENQLLSIEAGGADIDVELVNTVFRAVHSIKGVAGFLGLVTINDLAHRLENVLNQIRNRQLCPDSAMVEVMLRAADSLRNLVNDAAASRTADVSRHLAALDAISQGRPASHRAADVQPQSPPEEQAAPAGPTDESADLPAEDENGASHNGTVEDPAVEGAAEEAAEDDRAEAASPASDESSSPTHTKTMKKPKNAAVANELSIPTAAPLETNIRVAVGVLDHLMNLAGELVLSRNQLLQAVASDDKAGLGAVAAGLDQVTSELQEAIMQTRMQPIGNVFSRFPRVVRDLSNKLDKQCRLVVEGKEVEVDKTIVEAIGDPLTHLVRNSVDHGIELPQQRVAAGKPPEGTVQISAYHQAGKVCVDVRDDGAGIDPQKLKAKALSKGLISAEKAEQMGDREVLRLIFHPGFSMAAKVTDVSGRGVGMDVVRTNVEQLGGTVDVESELGVGTTIHLTLPLTLAIIPSLIVQCHEDRFAIPQVNIAELVRVRPNELGQRIGRVKSAEVLRLRGSLLPLVRLNEALRVACPDKAGPDKIGADKAGQENKTAQAINIIVVETGATRYGLVVDGLHDSEEIVVKPMGRHLKQCHCLAGATILGDGYVALILDVAGIASRSELRVTEQSDEQQQEADLHGSEETQSLLLFTSDPQEQFGIPMSVVARIERIRAEQIDAVGGQELLQYRGGSLPLLSLEHHIQARPRPQVERMYVVVFEIAGREVGLIAPYLADIREVSTDVDTVMFREQGVVGSLVVDNMATRILDLYELVQTAHPDWFTQTLIAPTPEGRTPTILLAEDSTFFRKQVIGFLEAEGYEVVGCEDGLVAWETLLADEYDIDLVITDIEMPNMDGFELSRKIKENPALRHLPIVALTSLAGSDDMARGLQCGIDDYQIKMDREKLVASVFGFLKSNQKTGRGAPVLQPTESGV